MANELERLSRHLALNLTSLRGKQGLSQGALAKLSGVPRSTLAHFESGAGNPSLANLARISAGLQISLEELLSRPRSRIRLIPATEVRVEKRGGGTASIFKLLPDPLPGMEIDRLEIKPGGRLGGIPHVAGTKEYLTCIAGEMTVAVGGEKYRVLSGDVLAFPGDQPHSYHNTGSSTAICLSVVALVPVGL